jgi:hypothetical protein
MAHLYSSRWVTVAFAYISETDWIDNRALSFRNRRPVNHRPSGVGLDCVKSGNQNRYFLTEIAALVYPLTARF